MKIRTRLVLMLSAALVLTMATATWLRMSWTRQALETRSREQASETALAIADDLERRLKDDTDDAGISELLKFELRRHRTVANIGLTFDTDEETTVSFSLDFAREEPDVKHTVRPSRKQRPTAQRRDEARRALLDHGLDGRPPGERLLEPLWRTPDRAESTRWARLAPRPQPAARRITREFLVDLRDEAQKQEPKRRYLEVAAPVDPEGPRSGQLTVRVALDTIDRLIRTDQVISASVTGAAVLLLMLITAYTISRVVARPVVDLERAMSRIEQGGDLSLRVAEVRQDEIGALSRGFNAMLGRLSQAHEEIRAFNLRLTDEVRAATLDLERKNEALAQLNRLLVETQRELGDKDRLAALGQLAAQLAHELGTPLGSVSGHLQLAMAARDLPPSVGERLGVANRELERVSRIVRDYLDSTRPLAPTRVACDLGKVVDEALGIARTAHLRPGLLIEKEVDPAATQVDTDPGLVRQILVNLLTNAIDATSSSDVGGRITVRLSGLEGAVELAVTDDGHGVRPEDAARIFEPFYTTKGRGKGTGLGLAICRELASALGGRIRVASAPGAGSTFTVTLPRQWDSGRATIRG